MTALRMAQQQQPPALYPIHAYTHPIILTPVPSPPEPTPTPTTTTTEAITTEGTGTTPAMVPIVATSPTTVATGR